MSRASMRASVAKKSLDPSSESLEAMDSAPVAPLELRRENRSGSLRPSVGHPLRGEGSTKAQT